MELQIKKAGIRTQVLIVISEIIIKVLNSELCGISSDGGMFLNMKLYNDDINNKEYCIVLDGEHYTIY